jgi:hypothetical protein
MEAVMNTSKKPVLLAFGNLGVVLMVMACAAVGAFHPDQESLRIEDNMVEVRDDTGDWRSAAADSAFEMTAKLERIDPWIVAGKTLTTNESTEIADGLQVGDLVLVRGTILEDNTWLASSIALAEEQVDPIIILIGRVNSVDPWVVNEIPLNVTEETEIQGTITPGMIVRVEILLLADGTWQVLSIIPLEDVSELPGCTAVVAVIVSIEGSEIQLLGWPGIKLASDVKVEGVEGTLSKNQVVLVVVCPNEDDQIVIVQIIIIKVGDDENTPAEADKGLVCHKPSKNTHTLSISSSTVPAHLGHGDILGPCP